MLVLLIILLGIRGKLHSPWKIGRREMQLVSSSCRLVFIAYGNKERRIGSDQQDIDLFSWHMGTRKEESGWIGQDQPIRSGFAQPNPTSPLLGSWLDRPWIGRFWWTRPCPSTPLLLKVQVPGNPAPLRPPPHPNPHTSPTMGILILLSLYVNG